MGSLCKQLLGRPPLGFPGKKMPVLALRPRIQVGAQGVLPTGSEHGADRLRLTSSLLQSKHDGTAEWRLPWHLLGVWEPSLGAEPQGPLPLKNDLPASTSQLGVTLSPQVSGNAFILGGRKGSPREWVFRPLSRSECVALQTPDLQACSQGLNSGDRAKCLPALCKPCKHIARSARSCPWGRRLQECVRGVTWPRAPGTAHEPPARGQGQPLACQKPKQGAKLALAERSKQPREAFASSC